MRRVLVITAVDVEARALGRHLGLARPRGLAGLWYRGDAVDIACAGPGARHLERLGDFGRRADFVVSAGTCGALAPQLRIGDLVIPDTVLTLAGGRHALSSAPGLSTAGVLLSVEAVIGTVDSKARLWRETAALAVDMESATIARWAATLDRHAIAIRGVSDTATHAVPEALARLVDGEGRTHAVRAVRAVLGHPRLLARALALGRGTAIALRAVAGAIRVLSTAPGRYASGPGPSGPDGEGEGRSGARCRPAWSMGDRARA